LKALLEFIQARGVTAEMSQSESIRRLRDLLTSQLTTSRLRGLREATLAQPPRVRAILGTLLAYADLPENLWEPLKTSLNPLTRFDFRLFPELPNATEWQAK
jgi:hypothetical protein